MSWKGGSARCSDVARNCGREELTVEDAACEMSVDAIMLERRREDTLTELVERTRAVELTVTSRMEEIRVVEETIVRVLLTGVDGQRSRLSKGSSQGSSLGRIGLMGVSSSSSSSPGLFDMSL